MASHQGHLHAGHEAHAGGEHEVLPPGSFSGSVSLLITCACMFFGAFGAGVLPAILPISDSKLKTINAVGAGLLVGSALCVILPEGFESLHEAQEGLGDGEHGAGYVPGLMLLLGFSAMLLLDVASHQLSHKQHSSPPVTPEAHVEEQRSGSKKPAEMLQTCGGHSHKHSHGNGGSSDGSDPAQTALIGLLVHSVADGLAVGAASLSPNVAVAAAVALAMVLHKGPVAFGLTSFLRASDWPWHRVQKGLTIFAVTSPVTAILTFLIFTHIPSLTTHYNIALCVLFSGGTFLYAACIHILPSVLDAPTRAGLAAVLGGSVVPLVLSSLVPHHH